MLWKKSYKVKRQDRYMNMALTKEDIYIKNEVC